MRDDSATVPPPKEAKLEVNTVKSSYKEIRLRGSSFISTMLMLGGTSSYLDYMVYPLFALTWHGYGHGFIFFLIGYFFVLPSVQFLLGLGAIIRSAQPRVLKFTNKRSAGLVFLGLLLASIICSLNIHKASQFLQYGLNSFKFPLPWEPSNDVVDACAKINNGSMCLDVRQCSLFQGQCRASRHHAARSFYESTQVSLSNKPQSIGTSAVTNLLVLCLISIPTPVFASSLFVTYPFGLVVCVISSLSYIDLPIRSLLYVSSPFAIDGWTKIINPDMWMDILYFYSSTVLIGAGLFESISSKIKGKQALFKCSMITFVGRGCIVLALGLCPLLSVYQVAYSDEIDPEAVWSTVGKDTSSLLFVIFPASLSGRNHSSFFYTLFFLQGFIFCTFVAATITRAMMLTVKGFELRIIQTTSVACYIVSVFPLCFSISFYFNPFCQQLMFETRAISLASLVGSLIITLVTWSYCKEEVDFHVGRPARVTVFVNFLFVVAVSSLIPYLEAFARVAHIEISTFFLLVIFCVFSVLGFSFYFAARHWRRRFKKSFESLSSDSMKILYWLVFASTELLRQDINEVCADGFLPYSVSPFAAIFAKFLIPIFLIIPAFPQLFLDRGHECDMHSIWIWYLMGIFFLLGAFLSLCWCIADKVIGPPSQEFLKNNPREKYLLKLKGTATRQNFCGWFDDLRVTGDEVLVETKTQSEIQYQWTGRAHFKTSTTWRMKVLSSGRSEQSIDRRINNRSNSILSNRSISSESSFGSSSKSSFGSSSFGSSSESSVGSSSESSVGSISESSVGSITNGSSIGKKNLEKRLFHESRSSES